MLCVSIDKKKSVNWKSALSKSVDKTNFENYVNYVNQNSDN
jgi:hypothetical protein